MSKLGSAALYIANHLGEDQRLSRNWLFKLLFLADWKSSLDYGQPVTEITWRPNSGDSIVGQVPPAGEKAIVAINEISGAISGRELRDLVERYDNLDELSADDTRALDFVVGQARGKPWASINKIVFSTWPFLSGSPGDSTPVDLTRLAAEYKSARELPRR